MKANWRIFIILAVGCAAMLATFLVSDQLLWRNRYLTDSEWRIEREAKERPERIAEYDRSFREAIANAANERDRKQYEFDYRIFQHAVKYGEVASLLDASNGVDEFEAYFIAREYTSWYISSCFFLSLPEMKDGFWINNLVTGRECVPHSPIVINARSGAIRCTGYSDIPDVAAFIRGPRPPNNEPLQPTPTAVTSPTAQEPRQP